MASDHVTSLRFTLLESRVIDHVPHLLHYTGPMNARYFPADARNISGYLIPESRRQERFDLIRHWDRHEKVYDDIISAFGYGRIPGSPSDGTFVDPVDVSGD